MSIDMKEKPKLKKPRPKGLFVEGTDEQLDDYDSLPRMVSDKYPSLAAKCTLTKKFLVHRALELFIEGIKTGKVRAGDIVDPRLLRGEE